MTTNRALLLLAIAAAILLAIGLNRCDVHDIGVVNMPSEVIRIKSFNADSIHRAAYRQAEAKYLAENNALKAKVATLEGKDKQATTKAQRSASTFAGSGKLEDCKTALMDCQEEAGTKAAVITVLKQQVATVTQQRIADSSEINRLVLRADTLNQGWKDANAAVADALKPRVRLFATAAFEQGPVTNNAKIGATVNYDRLSIGYKKGLIKNTNEVEAGWLIRLKK